jgi:hypothetical protein
MLCVLCYSEHFILCLIKLEAKFFFSSSPKLQLFPNLQLGNAVVYNHCHLVFQILKEDYFLVDI